jgi:hypothetical protein
VLVDRNAPRALDSLVEREDAALITSAASSCPPQWRKIIVRRFGLDGRPPMTLAAVGDTLGLSRERVRQIEAKAMERLRARLDSGLGRSHERSIALPPRDDHRGRQIAADVEGGPAHVEEPVDAEMMPIPSGGTPTMPRISATTGSDPAGTPAVPMPPSTQMPTTTSWRAKPSSTP